MILKNRITELDGIRGFAALNVMLFHVPCWNKDFYDINFIRNGYLWVDLFFVLSGFVISLNYSLISSIRELFRFQCNRFLRLYPLHFIFLIVFLFFEIGKFFLFEYLKIKSPNTTPFVENNIIAFVFDLFLIKPFGPYKNILTFNLPSWSISVEFFTYLIFSILTVYFKKTKTIVFVAIAVIIFSINFFDGIKADLNYEYSIFRCLLGFSLGYLLNEFYKYYGDFLLPKFLDIIFASVIFFLINQGFFLNNGHFFALISTVFLGVIIYSKGGFLAKLLNSKIFNFLGRISYSIYISHASVLWVHNQIIRFVLKAPENLIPKYSVPYVSFLNASFIYVSIFFSTIILSYFLHNYVELPLIKKYKSV